MTRYSRHLIPLGLVLAIVGCRFNANRPPIPAGSSRPGSDVTAQPALPGTSSSSTTASPTPAASSSTATAIPVIAQMERDLRHIPQDIALSPDGTVWLLADDGIWQRKPGATTWTADAPLKTLELPAAPGNPPAEIVTDPAGQPWLLDPAGGKLWKHAGTAQWQVAASGLVGAQGLSVAADGTAYAVASGSETTAGVWRVQAGALQALSDKAWKHPVTTVVDAKGGLLVIDDGTRMVHRYGTDQKQAAIPPALGRLTIGRDADGTPLIVGGQRAFTAIRINDKTLGYPTLPITSLPMASSGSLSAIRLFILPSGQYLAMARTNTGTGTTGEMRTVTTVGRKPGETYAPSTSYTGTAMAVRTIARREADKLGENYQLCRIRGINKTAEATNRTAAWYYDFFRIEDASLVTISIAPQGLQIERAYMPEGLPPPTALGDIAIDSHQAWAASVKAGMPNQVTGDMELLQDGSQAFWRVTWTSGGQTYRVDAATGTAGLDTN